MKQTNAREKKNIARGTTDPEIDPMDGWMDVHFGSWAMTHDMEFTITCKVGHQIAPLGSPLGSVLNVINLTISSVPNSSDRLNFVKRLY